MTVRIVVRVTIYILTLFLVLLAIPGIDEKAIALVGLGIGVIVSFSSTTTIGNAVAGVILHFSRPIREGDRIQIEDTVGDVVNIELLFVHIKTIKDIIVSIPSLKVLNSKIINYSALDKFILSASLTLGYELDPGLVEDLLVKACSKTQGLMDEPPPFVLIRSLKDYTVEYEVNGYTDNPNNMVKILSQLQRQIILEFTNANVQIMSPAYIDIMQLSADQKVLPKCVTNKRGSVDIEKEQITQRMVEAKQQLEEKKRKNIKI